MKILHLIESTATGTLSISMDLANSQNQRGHEVHYYYGRRPETPHDVEEGFSTGINLVEVSFSIFSIFLTMIVLRRYTVLHHIDVVHLHSSTAGFVGRLALLFCPVQIIYSPHCISFMRKDIGWIKKRVFILLERFASIRKSHYVACSESEKFSIQTVLGIQDVSLVENFYSPQSDIQASALFSTPVRIVTSGGIRAQKGPIEFSEIARKLINDGFDVKWIGDGEDNLKSILSNAGVKISGWVNREEVIRLLKSADIFLSTSKWEGMPVSIIEAMACGAIPVVSACEGNIDLIRHGVNGFIFNNRQEALDYIEILVKSPELVSNMLDEMRNDVLFRFSEERFLQDFEIVYDASLRGVRTV